ncbi:MAG: DUF177 domain-containing protein [Pseudomonadota bacterium]
MVDESVRWQGSPVSQLVNVATLPQKGRTVVVQPDVDALAKLAEELGVVAVANLRAEVQINKWQRDGIRLGGPLKASVTQTCVVTLEPFQVVIETEIEALFVPETSRIAKRHQQGESNEILIDPQSDDAPETFVPPDLDVGGAVQEFLALAIDPYPKSPAADEMSTDTKPVADETEGKANPFSVLAHLKNHTNNDV